MIGTDPRVSIRDYAENQVITFAARPNYQSTIQFGDEERIENIAVGESGAMANHA
jgi:type IV secretion system protein VirB9